MVGGQPPVRSSGASPSSAPGASTAAATAALTGKRSSSRSHAVSTAAKSTLAAKSTPAAAPSRSKLTAPLKGQWAAQAVAPQLRGQRAAAWIAVWDKAAVMRRVALLEALKTLHAESNVNALEDDLGDAAPLFFARLTSWWKLRYAAWVVEAAAAASAQSTAATTTGITTAAASAATTAVRGTGGAPAAPAGVVEAASVGAAPSPVGAASPPSSPPAAGTSELLAQVEAITIFVRGSRYLLQFVEGGGAAAVCDCLDATSSLPRSPNARGTSAGGPCDAYALERRALTLLLLHVANSGRVYREMVGEVEGLLRILRALLRESDPSVALPITELLAVLGKGHPRLCASVQTGLLRVLAAALPPLAEGGDGRAAAVGQQKPPPSHGSRTDGAGEAEASEVVVLSSSRAIRALQLQAEQQHYATFTSGVGDVHALAAGSAALTSSAAALVDSVPIVGLDAAATAGGFAAGIGVQGGGAVAALVGSADPLLRPLTTSAYLDTLFRLALDEHHTAFRVEGNELLNLAAKNIQLTPKILTRCLDVVDDDAYVIEGGVEDGLADDSDLTQQRLRRQRRQLSCGRAAVLILISRPMTAERRELLLQLVAQRGGHLTLLKYLRLTQHGDTAAVVDCCRALQFVVRASTDAQRRRMGNATALASAAGGRSKVSEAVLVRMTEGVQAVLGEAVFQLLLFQELTEEDCMTLLRSARAAVMSHSG